MKPKEDTALNDQLMEKMMAIGKIIRHRMILDSSLTQLTLLQFETLSYLKKNEKVQMKDISNYFKISKPTATALLTKLISLKLIERLSDKKDRRVVQVQLTKLGENLFENVAKEKKKKVHNLLNVLTAEEKNNLDKIMSSILNNAKEIYEK